MNNDISELTRQRNVKKNYNPDVGSQKMVEIMTKKTAVKVRDPPKKHDRTVRRQPKRLANNDEYYNYIDFEGITKLRKLCGMLRTNVTQLKVMYEKQDSRGLNINSDQIDLETGLQTLDNDLMQLYNKLDDMKGSRKEMRKVISLYRDYELQYKFLKSLNKKVKRTMRSNRFCRSIRDYLCCLCIKKTQWYEN